MNTRSQQQAGLGIGALLVFAAAVLASGLLVPAILLGVLASGATWAIFRDGRLAAGAGVAVALLVMTVGALNVLSPGWFQALIAALTAGLL